MQYSSTKNDSKRPKTVNQLTNPVKRRKKTANACLLCRNKHLKCPGGSPCSNCENKGVQCEYTEQKKKIVTSMKYLMDLQDDILRLKRENLELLRQLDELKSMQNIEGTTVSEKKTTFFINDEQCSNLTEPDEEIASTFAQRSGRLINSTLDQTYFVGSSSMTLFGLEIESLISKYLTGKIFKPLPTASVSPPPLSTQSNTSYSLSNDSASSKSLSSDNPNDNIDSNNTLSYPSPTNKLQIFIKQI